MAEQGNAQLYSGPTSAPVHNSAQPQIQTRINGDSTGTAGSFASFFNRSFPLGKLCGIPIRIHILFPLVIVLAVLNGAYLGGWFGALWFFVLIGPILFGAVLVHEFGHSLAALHVHQGQVDHILLWPLGGLAYVGHGGSPFDDLKVAVAGPLTHVPMVAIWMAILAASNHGHLTLDFEGSVWDDFWLNLVVAAIWLNIGLFCFNLLLPAFPLDGGRILVDLLLICGLSPATSAKVSLCLSTPIAIGIIVWGFLGISIITIFVGAWVLLQNVQLFLVLSRGQIAHHPLFANIARDDGQQMTGQV